MMSLKNKKRMLKTILVLVFTVFVALSAIDQHKKWQIYGKFNEIIYSFKKSIPDSKEGDYGLFLSYCDTVSRFLTNNPIKLDFEFTFTDCNSFFENFETQEFQAEFMKQLYLIKTNYRRVEKQAKIRSTLIMIISAILISLSRYYIDKKFQVKINEAE